MDRIFGHRFGGYDGNDRPIAHLVGARRSAAEIPDVLSWEFKVDHVRDQDVPRPSGSCEGQGTANALALRAAIAGAPIAHPSPAALYALALQYDQGVSSGDTVTPYNRPPLADVGTFGRTVAFILATHGVCSEDRWPMEALFAPDGSVAYPPWDVLQAGGDARTTGYAWVTSTGEERCADICDALAKGFPLSFGMHVDKSFFDLGSETYMGPTGPSLGGHCQAIVGYDVPNRRFRVLGSYGTSFADHGFLWISFDVIGSPDICADFLVQEIALAGVE